MIVKMASTIIAQMVKLCQTKWLLELKVEKYLNEIGTTGPDINFTLNEILF